MDFLKNKSNLILLLLLIVGTALRFYNLLWGAPFFFHPDERNIAGILSSPFTFKSISESTFAYGNFLLLVGFFLKPLFAPLFLLLKISDPFSQSVTILRTLSATTSVLTLFFLYKGSKIFSERAALAITALATFSVGLIQQSHFGTFDGFLVFCSVLVWNTLVHAFKKKSIHWYYLSLVCVGLGAATKISFIIVGVVPFLLLFIIAKKDIKIIAKHLFLGILLLIATTLLLSPYYFTSDFRSALLYEQGVVSGSLPVFYTQSFANTPPIIFAFFHILPFLITPLITVIFPFAFLAVIRTSTKQKNLLLFLLMAMFVILFLPDSLLYAKWTRYMVPIIPFVYMIVVVSLTTFSKRFQSIGMLILIFVNAIVGSSYVISAYGQTDTRIAAAIFAHETIPSNAPVLSEPYDIGVVVFSPLLTNIQIAPLYDIEHNLPEESSLNRTIDTSSYILLPSQRLLRSRILNPSVFPVGHNFYSRLLNGALGFKKIYQTPCDIFCTIAYAGDPIFHYEETATVFDRPTIMLFKKK